MESKVRSGKGEVGSVEGSKWERVFGEEEEGREGKINIKVRTESFSGFSQKVKIGVACMPTSCSVLSRASTWHPW